MNTKNAKKDKEAKKGIEFIKVDSWGVERVRCIDTKRGDMVVFTLKLNGVSISNCRVATTKDGRDFVSFPQYQGKDGKYYSYIYAPLSEEAEAAIMEKIQEELDAE